METIGTWFLAVIAVLGVSMVISLALWVYTFFKDEGYGMLTLIANVLLVLFFVGYYLYSGIKYGFPTLKETAVGIMFVCLLLIYFNIKQTIVVYPVFLPINKAALFLLEKLGLLRTPLQLLMTTTVIYLFTYLTVGVALLKWRLEMWRSAESWKFLSGIMWLASSRSDDEPLLWKLFWIDTFIGVASAVVFVLIIFVLISRPFRKTALAGEDTETAPVEEEKKIVFAVPEVFGSAFHRSHPAPDFSRFLDFASDYIVGQEKALAMVQKTLAVNAKRLSMGDRKKERVLAVMLFAGPTGVGKTETAKVLAQYLKNYGYKFLRIDANQYSTREAVWSLLGSVKGYIGSDKPGILPSAIAENPRLVLLIDEIEKASRSFYEPLLQLLDEGYVVERSTGEVFYTQRAIILMTSNIENRQIGLLAQSISDPVELDLKVREALERARRYYSSGNELFELTPEFLGRIDAVVPFSNLSFEHLVLIAVAELKRMGVKPDPQQVIALAKKYRELADKYGVRYFIKKITEEALLR